MTDGKILLQDLADKLAVAEGLQKNEATAFARMFFETIIKGLYQDRLVKVKGLGTFKLVTVEDRESINVNTGERFMIEGHAKISFTPDNGLKEMVNRPFSHFETVVLNDFVTDEVLDEVDRRFGGDLEESTDYLEENVPVAPSFLKREPKPVKPEPVKPAPVVEPVTEKTPVVPVPEPVEEQIPASVESIVNESASEAEPEASVQEPVVGMPASQSVAAEEPLPAKPDTESSVDLEVKEEPVKESVEVVQPVVAPTPVQPLVAKTPEPLMEYSTEDETYEKSARNKGFIFWWIMLLPIALLCGFAIGYFNLFDLKENAPTVVVDTVVVQKVVPAEVDTVVQAPKPTPVVEEQPKPVEQEPNPALKQVEETGKYTVVGTKESYTLQHGETLRIVAEKYYGSRVLASYIAAYNKIEDPNLVSAGTVILIPELKRKTE